MTFFSSPPVFLAGYTDRCCLSFNTGADSSIPEGATVRLVANSNITFSIEGVNVEKSENSEDKQTTVTFNLPYIPPESTHNIHMTFTLPLLESCDTDQTDITKLRAWRHEVYDITSSQIT